VDGLRCLACGGAIVERPAPPEPRPIWWREPAVWTSDLETDGDTEVIAPDGYCSVVCARAVHELGADFVSYLAGGTYVSDHESVVRYRVAEWVELPLMAEYLREREIVPDIPGRAIAADARWVPVWEEVRV
jgi:hypothetical protein